MTKRERFVTEKVPMELWELILNHLNQDDLLSISLVCKNFLKISNNLVKSVQVSSPDMLSQYLKRFKKIQSIGFNNFEGDIDDAFKELLASNSEIKNLRLLHCYPTKGVGYDLSMIANCFPSLEQLQILSSYKWVGNSLPRIDLSLWSSSKFKLLRKVDFFNFNDITDLSLHALSLESALLEDVTLSSCTNVTEIGIGCLLRNRPNLKALSIEHIGVSSRNSAIINIKNSIPHAKALASLKLKYVGVSVETVNAIAKAKLPLKEFTLVQFPECSALMLSRVLHSSDEHLRKLSIATCDAKMKFLLMDGLVGQNITHIDIQDSSETTVATLSLLLTKCPSLVDLRMHLKSNHRTGPLNFPCCKQHHNIRIVSFVFHGEIYDAFVMQMGRSFPNLQIVELLSCRKTTCRGYRKACNKATSRGIEALLRSCRCITKLILRGYIRERILMEMDEYSQQLNLEELELIGSEVDDKGFAAVAQRCPRLVSLKLSKCKKVSTEGIKHIVRNIKTLQCLELSNLDRVDYHNLLEWMLSTGNTASLKRIFISWYYLKDEQINNFLHRGCFLCSIW